MISRSHLSNQTPSPDAGTIVLIVVRTSFITIVSSIVSWCSSVFSQDYSPEDNEMLDSSHHENGEMKHMLKEDSKSYEWALLAGAADRLCGLAFLLIVAVSVPPNLTWT